jgi:FkbM family methyltransferase
VVTHKYGGHSFSVHLHDPISVEWYDRDWDRLIEIEFLSKFRLESGGIVFDIGAHQCVVAMMLSKEVGGTGRVIAVEPHPFNIRIAKRNLSENNIQNVTLVEAMISSSSGVGFTTFQLNARVVDVNSTIGTHRVRSMTLDELYLTYGRPAVVYLDVEGYEYEAVKGAGDVLNGPTDWYVELHGDDVASAYGGSNDDVVRVFLTKGFEVYVAGDDWAYSRISMEAGVPRVRCHIVAIRRT